MNKLEKQLIVRATRIHKKIYPCADKTSFSDCFTLQDGRLVFWYNTEDSSTHIVTLETSKKSSCSKLPDSAS